MIIPCHETGNLQTWKLLMAIVIKAMKLFNAVQN